MATIMTKSQFAKHINVKPGYVTQLQTAGRLVMEGDKVNVEASIARIEATRDPSKAGVAARHEKARAEKQSEQTPTIDDTDEMTGNHGSLYQQARAKKEMYAALQAEIAFKKEIGQLLVADEAKAVVADGDAVIRNRLESLPDLLAPQLAAESDEQKVRAMLMDTVEQLLGELSRSFYQLAKQ
jgi:pyruvate/2-oxoglutarate dehydrogenase complex dihydrolipoamide acyltransferase (E2) component